MCSEPEADAISVCIITRNEEMRLPRSLQSLSFADEIIVLDSESTDRTRDIARSFGAKVFVHEFDNFVNQKNRAIALAQNAWVLVVDADEVVCSELREEILDIVHDRAPAGKRRVAYRIPRMTFYLGRWIRHGGWYPDYNIRLFRRGAARFAGGTVHERALVEGSVGVLLYHLEHYSYEDISQHMLRMNHYSTLIAQDKYARGRRSSPLWAVLKGFSKFFITYFYRGGFLDGWAGLVIAVLGGYYNFLKYVKLWELRRLGRKEASNPSANERATTKV